MCLRLLILLMVVCLSGCAARSRPDGGGGSESRSGNSDEQEGPGVVVPAAVGPARVESVNQPLRFVVLDFTLRPMPPVDQRLGLYRGSQKVGEVKITGPAMDGYVAADLVSGSAQSGDEARPE